MAFSSPSAAVFGKKWAAALSPEEGATCVADGVKDEGLTGVVTAAATEGVVALSPVP